jgi:hypothetical protein
VNTSTNTLIHFTNTPSSLFVCTPTGFEIKSRINSSRSLLPTDRPFRVPEEVKVGVEGDDNEISTSARYVSSNALNASKTAIARICGQQSLTRHDLSPEPVQSFGHWVERDAHPRQ